MAIIAAAGPDHHDHAIADITNGDVTDLAIVEAVIDSPRLHAGENQVRIDGEIEPAMLQRLSPFCRIERRRHALPAAAVTTANNVTT